jgi:hypothetical protein
VNGRSIWATRALSTHIPVERVERRHGVAHCALCVGLGEDICEDDGNSLVSALGEEERALRIVVPLDIVEAGLRSVTGWLGLLEPAHQRKVRQHRGVAHRRTSELAEEAGHDARWGGAGPGLRRSWCLINTKRTPPHD